MYAKKRLGIRFFFVDIACMNYPGGKGGVYHKLINLMPPHEIYIEAYLGGEAVMRHKYSAKRNIGVEIDSEVIQMWREITKQ